MRMLLWLLVALAWIGQGEADDKPAEKEATPVSASSAHAYVRRLAMATRKDKDGLGKDATDWGVRPSELSRWAFGADYDQLSKADQKRVDSFMWFVTLGMLRRMHDGRGAPLDLASHVIEGGHRVVRVPAGRRTAEIVVARNKSDGQIGIVDVGLGGERFGDKLKGLWTVVCWKAGEEVDRRPLLMEFVASIAKKTQEKARKVKTKDNIRLLVTLMLVKVTERGWKYFPYGGKCFVLGPVASGDLDKTQADHLAVLYSPTVPKSKYAPLEAYKDVTRDALKAGRDCSKLTSYAGRRNNEAAYRITAAEESAGTIIIADLSFEDVVIAGWSNGRVGELSREQLGLGPDDHITVGDESKSPMLKKLSLK